MSDLFIYALALLGGVLAGIINTLVGSGSLVTLPLLAMLGLPANEANATNRVGIISQCSVGTATFYRAGKLELRNSRWYVLPPLLGALFGAQLAAHLSATVTEWVLGVVMILMLVIVLHDADRWVKPPAEGAGEGPLKTPTGRMLGVFFAVGVYGGLIQAGVGSALLIALVTGAGEPVARANALKLLIALGLAIASLIMFLPYGLIHWPMGLLMAVGQSVGAWTGARWLSRYEGAGVWVRRVLIVTIVLGMLRFFGAALLATVSAP